MVTTCSPLWIRPRSRAYLMVSWRSRFAAPASSSSPSSCFGSLSGGITTGTSPRVSSSCRATVCPLVYRSLKPTESRRRLGTTPTTTGTLGRYLAMSRAALPLAASTTMHFTPSTPARKAAEEESASITLRGSPWVRCGSGAGTCPERGPGGRRVGRTPPESSGWVGVEHFSASSQMEAMMRTASPAKFPFAVSPESITASVPSSTALATSVASARVGRGLQHIDSSICVAVITGLPARLHCAMICFCAANMCSTFSSMPRSPRATMTPSAVSMMDCTLSSPCWFSILAMILIQRPPLASRKDRTVATSLAVRTKETAMKSTLFSMPHSRSRRSLSVSTGRSTMAPGRLQFFSSPTFAVFSAWHLTVLAA
mmetsp:Transcript_5815/g.11871  ORF Transcript_5815/g.11871 Transcript_5815/m.11871 type:complete len:370 (+) Transcript_5815:257-1366(+)